MSKSSSLTTSGSIAAMCFYWRHHPPPDLEWGWMVLCFPAEAVYVRPLRHGEWRTYWGSLPCYGAFDQFTFALIAVSGSLAQLQSELRASGYLPMHVL
jgi:hypothetical protein